MGYCCIALGAVSDCLWWGMVEDGVGRRVYICVWCVCVLWVCGMCVVGMGVGMWRGLWCGVYVCVCVCVCVREREREACILVFITLF